MHADTAGTKTSLAYLYWKETGDISVWRGIAQDALVMNLDDMACCGCLDDILISNTIARNKHLIPGEVIEEIIEGYPFLAARVKRIKETAQVTTQAEALALQLRERAVEILSLLPGVPAELAHALQATRAPSDLADITASLLDTEVNEKQMLLETIDTEERLQKVLQILSRRIEVLRLSQEIGERTKEQMEDRERKYLLHEQLKAIQKELGEDGGNDQEIAQLNEAITKAGMPSDIEAQTRKELQRLQRMPSASSEYSMLHTYLEWMTELPWRLPEETPIDLNSARQILEADHFGLERIKQRVIEFLAVQKLKPHGRAPILCLSLIHI